MKSTELQKRIITSVILLTILALMYLYSYILISVLLIFSFLSFFEFNVLINKIFKNKNFINIFIKLIISLIGLIYITFFSFIMFSAFSTFEDKVLFLFTLSVCIGSDLGGIIFGKIFKGKKLTKISPNKTVSGLVGSYIVAFLFMLIYYLSFNDFEIRFLMVITFIISTISQIGDLFFSYLKRKAVVKNTSNLLPGHGGILDRVDGIIFGAPVGFLITTINF
jgi:phosphatidate cytidylyltransferase